MKFWNWIKLAVMAIGKFILDLFTNIKGWADPHKIAGYIILTVAVLSAIRPNAPISMEMFIAMATVAGALIGVSLVGDHQALKSDEPSRY